jgi:hypothetical protein
MVAALDKFVGLAGPAARGAGPSPVCRHVGLVAQRVHVGPDPRILRTSR